MQPQPKGACIMNTLTGHSNNRQPNPPIVSGEDARRRALALAQGLYPHQVECLAFLLGRRGSILADDMGSWQDASSGAGHDRSSAKRALVGGVPSLGQTQLGP